MKRRTASGLLDFLGHNAIALIALFVALGGTAYAATALPAGSVGTTQLKKNAVTGAKVKDNSIKGADVLESSLGKVPSAASADSATSATNATHATSADSATNATHATSADSAANATHAANADTLGGVSKGVFGTAVRYAGLSFKPRDSATGYSAAPGAGMVRTSGSAFFTTPVLLPQGAKVTKLTFVFNNVVTGSSGPLIFSRYLLDGQRHGYRVGRPARRRAAEAPCQSISRRRRRSTTAGTPIS